MPVYATPLRLKAFYLPTEKDKERDHVSDYLSPDIIYFGEIIYRPATG